MRLMQITMLMLLGILSSSTLIQPIERAFAQPMTQSSAVVEPIDVNRATTGELEMVRGLGPSLAARIVSYRDEFGKFESLDGLTEVRGIGEAKLSQIREQLAI